MAVRREGLVPLSVVVGWHDELAAGMMTRVSYVGEERQRMERLPREKRVSGKDRDAHEHRCVCVLCSRRRLVLINSIVELLRAWKVRQEDC